MGVTLVSGNLGSETLSGDFLSYYFVKLKKMASTSSTVIFVILSACSSLMRATAITDWDTPYANAVTKATNEHRQSQGLEPLTLDSWLTSTAQEWADHLASSCQFDHRTRGRRMPELRTLLAAASSILMAVSLSWAGRTPLATTKICLEITKSWGWVLPRSEAASSSVRLLGTRTSRRQQLLLQCMESHSLTLRVLEWIPLRLSDYLRC